MSPETLAVINAICAGVNAIAVIVLVVVTTWYARSTANMLSHMADQAKATRNQSRILVIAARIAATAPLLNLMYDEGKARRRLEELGKELDKAEQEST